MFISSGLEDDISCPLLQNSSSLPADTGFCACLPSFPEGKFYTFLIFDTPHKFEQSILCFSLCPEKSLMH